MFKDYGKYLAVSLKVYLFVLMLIFILKLVGLDYFGLDINNPIISKLNNFLINTNLIYIFDFITLYIMFYVCFSIICNKKEIKLFSFVITIIEFLLQFILLKINKYNEMKLLVDFILLLIPPILINKKIIIKKPIIMILTIIIYQLISYSIRGQYIMSNYNSKIIDIILNIDQYIMLLITYSVYFMKGDAKLCQQEVYSFSQKQSSSKKQLKKYQIKFSNKKEKFEFILYWIIYLLWNLFTLFLIMLIAKINGTLIECIFITISFWITKRVFGKAFHLPNVLQCFIVSNATYYILNRITTPLGISILIPIMLGIGLSYFTSKLVKKSYKPLYKGMPIDEFEETITKVIDKNSDKYKICYDFFIKKENAIKLAVKYNYTEAGIRKIKDRVNAKIRELE